jgi:hypothetical protein
VKAQNRFETTTRKYMGCPKARIMENKSSMHRARKGENRK